MLVPVLLYAVLFPDSIVAQAATDAGPWLTIANLGLAGVGLWAFVSGKIHSHGEYQRVVTKLDAAEAELRRRTDEDRGSLIPALVRSTDILAKQLDRNDRTPPPPTRSR